MKCEHGYDHHKGAHACDADRHDGCPYWEPVSHTEYQIVTDVYGEQRTRPAVWDTVAEAREWFSIASSLRAMGEFVRLEKRTVTYTPWEEVEE